MVYTTLANGANTAIDCTAYSSYAWTNVVYSSSKLDQLSCLVQQKKRKYES